jgi:regulatory protein
MPDPRDMLRARALKLLARRDLSRLEMEQRLSPFVDPASTDVLHALLDELAAGQLLSETRVAQTRVRVRGTRYGNLRLAHELRQAGLKDDLVATALAQGEDEILRCRDVWQKKFGAAAEPGSRLSPETRARQQRFLHARGFSPDAIRATLDNRDETHD